MSFLLQFQPGKSQEQLSAKRPKKLEITNLATNNRLKEKQHGNLPEDDSIIGVRSSSRRSISTRSSPGQQQLSIISTKSSPTQNLMINLSTKSLLTPLFQNSTSSKSNSTKEAKQDDHHQITDEFFLSNRFTKLPSKNKPKFGLLQNNSKSFVSNDTVNFSDALLTQTADEDQLKGSLFDSKEEQKLQMLSSSLSPNKPQTEMSSRFFPSTAAPHPLSNSNQKKKLIILKKQNFRDFSNLKSQRVDEIDGKITSKEYYDTSLLTQKQIDRMDVIRSNKQSMYFTALKNRGYAYQDNCLNSPRSTSNQFETIDTSDFHAISFTKKEAQDMLKPLISELQQKQKAKQEASTTFESIEQFDLKSKMPATRQDAVSLEEWLQSKTTELFESNILNGSDLFNEIQKLYSASLQELARQVSLQCTERGQLLKRIWTSYLSLFKKVLQFKSQESSSQEKALLNEVSRIHKMYGEQIQTVQDKFQIASAELLQSSETHKKLQAEITQLNGNINGLQWALYVKSQIVSDFRGNLKKLETENQRLTHKLSQQVQQKPQKLLYKQSSFSSAVIAFQSEEAKEPQKPTVIQETLDSDESEELEGSFNLHAPPITFDSIKSNGYFLISQDSGNSKGTDTNELVGEFLEKQKNQTEEIKRLKKLNRAQTQQLNKKRRFGEQYEAEENGQINNSLCIKQNYHKSLNDFGVRWTQQNMKGQRSSSLEFENEVRRTDDFLREWKNQKETKSGIKIVQDGCNNNTSNSEWTQLISELKSMQNKTNINVQGKLNELISCFEKIQSSYYKKITEIAAQNTNNNNSNLALLPNSSINQSSESSKILRNAVNSTSVTSFHVLQPVKSQNRISTSSLTEFEDEHKGLENEKAKEEQVKKYIKLSDEVLRKIFTTSETLDIPKQAEKQLTEWKVLSKQVTQLDVENLLGLLDIRQKDNRLEEAEGFSLFHQQFHGDHRKQQQAPRKSATNAFRDIEEANSQIFHVIQEDSEGVSNQSDDSSSNDYDALSSSNNKKFKPTQSDTIKKRKSQQRSGESEDERFPLQDDQLMSQISFGVIQRKSTLRTKDSKIPRVSQLNLSNLPVMNNGQKPGKNNNQNNPRRSTIQGLNRLVSQSPTSKRMLQQQTSIVVNDKFSAKRGSISSQNLIQTGTKLARMTSNQQITETTIPSPRRESISPRIKSLKSLACISEDAAFKIVQDILFEIKGAQMKQGGGTTNIITATLIQYDNPAVLKPYFSKINAIKFISSVYAESIRLPRSRNQRLYAAAYELLLNKYGLKRVAERKLEQYLKTCMALSPSSKRLMLFCRFCSLIVQPRELEIDEYNFFLQILQAMDDRNHSRMGFIRSLEESIICPLVKWRANNDDKMVEFLTGFLEKEEDHEKALDKDQNLHQIIIDALKPVAFMQNEVLFLDIDGSFEILVDLYRKKKQEVEKNVKKLFYAADLDKNECIELREFLTLYRYLENPSLRLQNVSKMFFDAADTRTKEGEKALTLERFAAVCLDNKLFSQSKQREFAQSYSPADYVKNIEELQLQAESKFTEIRMRLKFSGALSPAFESIISSIQSLLSPQRFKENSHKDMLWISYRLLDEDSKRLYLNKLVDSLLGDELLAITITHAQIEEHNSIEGCLSDSFA